MIFLFKTLSLSQISKINSRITNIIWLLNNKLHSQPYANPTSFWIDNTSTSPNHDEASTDTLL
jgi:hypothetical protein